jgi:hypothetical protein
MKDEGGKTEKRVGISGPYFIHHSAFICHFALQIGEYSSSFVSSQRVFT